MQQWNGGKAPDLIRSKRSSIKQEDLWSPVLQLSQLVVSVRRLADLQIEGQPASANTEERGNRIAQDKHWIPFPLLSLSAIHKLLTACTRAIWSATGIGTRGCTSGIRRLRKHCHRIPYQVKQLDFIKRARQLNTEWHIRILTRKRMKQTTHWFWEVPSLSL